VIDQKSINNKIDSRKPPARASILECGPFSGLRDDLLLEHRPVCLTSFARVFTDW